MTADEDAAGAEQSVDVPAEPSEHDVEPVEGDAIAAEGTATAVDEPVMSERLRQMSADRDALQARIDVARQDLGRGRLALTSLGRREKRIRSRMADVSTELQNVGQTRDDLRTWISRRTRSFAWALVSAMRAQRSALTGEQDAMRAVLATPLPTREEDLSRMRRVFGRLMLACLVLAAALVPLILWLGRAFPGLTRWSSWANIFTWSAGALTALAVSLFVIWSLVVLLAYHRRWSAQLATLRAERMRTDLLREAVQQARSEAQRIVTLHASVPEYLRLLSEVAHRPWVVSQARPPEGGSVREQLSVDFGVPLTPRPSADSLPAHLRLSETLEGGWGPAEQELVRQAIAQVLSRGWRTEAFENLLMAASVQRGLPPDAFSSARVDRDHRIRTALLETLDDGDVQRGFGAERVRQLFGSLQGKVALGQEVGVRPIEPDPTSGLDVSRSLAESTTDVELHWDEHLLEILTNAAPLSTTAFDLNGIPAREQLTSLAFGPERLRASWHTDMGEYDAYGVHEASTVELVIRVDTLREAIGTTQAAVFGRESMPMLNHDSTTGGGGSSSSAPTAVDGDVRY